MFRSKDRPPSGAGVDPLAADRLSPAAPQMPATGHAPLRGGAPDTSPAADRAASGSASAKLLIVGPDISLAGEITACDRLVVEGSVKVVLNRTRAIEITETGRFLDGRAEVEEAVISGIYEGELTVRGRLLIRATGRVSGHVRYGELEVERGGRLAGSVAVLAPATEPARSPAADLPEAPAEPAAPMASPPPPAVTNGSAQPGAGTP